MNDIDSYVVYKHPKDFPNEFVVRRWMANKGSIRHGELVGRGVTYEEAIAPIPQDRIPIGRCPEDDPCIFNVFV